MEDLDRVTIEALQRVDLFGSENTAEIAVNDKAVSCFATIAAALDELEARGILRGSASGARLSASERRAIKRHNYSQMIVKIAGTARDIKRGDETFDNKFRAPRRDRADLDWLEAGRAFAADLPAVKKKFTDYGHDADFIETLLEEADEFETIINEQNSALRQRIDSNTSIDSILDEALKALRTLKIIIPNIFSGNPGKLADWASASHIEKKTPKPKKSNTPVNT